MKIKKNKDQDFINASLISKMPIEIIMAAIATMIFIFAVGFLLKLENRDCKIVCVRMNDSLN